LPPATHTQSYALGTRQLLLIEPATPYADEQRAFLDWARSLVSSGREILGIVLTHHHIDHVGGAQTFSHELGVPLWAHEATAARLPELDISRRLDDDEVLTLDGPSPQAWRVLHTPGHAPGHICLFEPELGAVVVGDMVASEGTILIEPTDGDMAEYLRQLARLEAVGAKTALPAHGDPIPEPSQLFAHYVAHRLERERKVAAALEAAGSGGTTDLSLVPRAYADTPQAAWPLALLSVRAHLVKLVADGRARTDGERYWTP
jgi:glyoxylase-like metal-dependent hydrolase (beta-lactamase superfamily II)